MKASDNLIFSKKNGPRILVEVMNSPKGKTFNSPAIKRLKSNFITHFKPVQTIFSGNHGISCVITFQKDFLTARPPVEKRRVY